MIFIIFFIGAGGDRYQDGFMVRFFRYICALKVRFLLAALAVAVGSCSPTAAPVEDEKEPEVPDSLVARVASIYPAEKYVLIQRYGKLTIPDDSILYSQDAQGGSSNLKVTGERLGQFLAADILSGDVTIGDAVYLRTFKNEAPAKGKESLNSD